MISVFKHLPPAPIKEFELDLVEFGGMIGMRFYQDQWDSYSDTQKIKLALWMQKVEYYLKSIGYKTFVDPCIRPNMEL